MQMSKPRIIIADTDISYIIPLQQKFIEEYFEKIDLEIISEQNYYELFFVSPQKIDMLIVSEELYTPAIQRHNIGSIFLMTEQYTENQINESNVHQIYKYTSIKEIFNVIIGKGGAFLRSSNDPKKETQIIMVCSACGGVGKTTIALGISACLNKNYKRVLYINAARLHSFQTMLSNMSPITASDVYVKMATATNSVYYDIKHTIRNEGFSYIPPFRAALMSIGIEYSIYEKIAISAKRTNDYDYIVIDTDTVFDEDQARLMDIADKVIMVTRQNKQSVYATNVLVSNINRANSDKYIFVCNDFEEDETNVLISPDIVNKFSVADYVGHLSHYEQLKANDLANANDIQKIAFLIS